MSESTHNVISFPSVTPNCMVNYKEAFLSTCSTMKASIINALIEIVSMTQNSIYVLDEKNVVKLGRCYVLGTAIVNDHICLIFDSKPKLTKKAEYVVIRDEQDNSSFVEFDGNFYNWVALINNIQEEAKLINV